MKRIVDKLCSRLYKKTKGAMIAIIVAEDNSNDWDKEKYNLFIILMYNYIIILFYIAYS